MRFLSQFFFLSFNSFKELLFLFILIRYHRFSLFFHSSCRSRYFGSFDSVLLLYTHMHIHMYTCRIHFDAIIKTSDTVLRKIYLSLYLKGSCVRRSWRLNKDCNILTSPAPPDIAVYRSRSPGLLFSWTASQPEPHSVGCWLPPPHLVTNGSPNSTDFLYRILSLTHLISN